MEAVQSFAFGLAGGGDVPDILGGGRDHMLAALIVAWAFYSLFGRRLADDGLRFLAILVAGAAAMAAPAPLLLIYFVASVLVVLKARDAAGAHGASAPEGQRTLAAA